MLVRKTGPGGRKHVAVAMANKSARIVFALLTSEKSYDDRPVAA